MYSKVVVKEKLDWIKNTKKTIKHQRHEKREKKA